MVGYWVSQAKFLFLWVLLDRPHMDNRRPAYRMAPHRPLFDQSPCGLFRTTLSFFFTRKTRPDTNLISSHVLLDQAFLTYLVRSILLTNSVLSSRLTEYLYCMPPKTKGLSSSSSSF